MMHQKRIPVSLDQNTCLGLMPKRLKTVAAPPFSSKEKKEKLTERITTLQQLISPYGKTDTASVLLEALEYIRFLQEQVKVLSAPYLYNTTPTKKSQDKEAAAAAAAAMGLKAKGLCLVPVSFTLGVASSNGADIWAPVKTRRLLPDDFSIVTQT